SLASSFRWHSRSSPHAFTFFARQSGVVNASAGAMPPASTIHVATAATIAPPRAPLSLVTVRMMSSFAKRARQKAERTSRACSWPRELLPSTKGTPKAKKSTINTGLGPTCSLVADQYSRSAVGPKIGSMHAPPLWQSGAPGPQEPPRSEVGGNCQAGVGAVSRPREDGRAIRARAGQLGGGLGGRLPRERIVGVEDERARHPVERDLPHPHEAGIEVGDGVVTVVAIAARDRGGGGLGPEHLGLPVGRRLPLRQVRRPSQDGLSLLLPLRLALPQLAPCLELLSEAALGRDRCRRDDAPCQHHRHDCGDDGRAPPACFTHSGPHDVGLHRSFLSRSMLFLPPFRRR